MQTHDLPEHIQAGLALQEEQYGQSEVRAKNWRYLAYLEACILFCGLWVVYDLGRQPKREPVFYEVDSCTSTIRPMGVKPAGWMPGEDHVKKHLVLLSETLRRVGDDKDLMREAWSRAFYTFTEDGKKQFIAYLNDYKPLQQTGFVKTENPQVHPRSANTYYVRWTEKYENSQHVFQRQETWGAEFTFQRRAAQTPEEEAWAPETVYIQSFSFSREP